MHLYTCLGIKIKLWFYAVWMSLCILPFYLNIYEEGNLKGTYTLAIRVNKPAILSNERQYLASNRYLRCGSRRWRFDRSAGKKEEKIKN